MLVGNVYLFFFFFKQKTAYEIGTGDWSSDVCSSDLIADLTFPDASFTADIGSNHRQIVFTNTTNDEATGFIWDFGDGNSAEVGLDNRDTTYQYSADEIGRASCRERV